MPKMKSHSGGKKRVKRTGSGKMKVKRNSRNHLLQQKSRRQKSINRTLVIEGTENKTMKALLPYL